MAQKKNNDGIKFGCIFLFLGFYAVFQLFFVTSTSGWVDRTESYTDSTKNSDGSYNHSDKVRVWYSYKVDDKEFTGSETLDDRYSLRDGSTVKVRYWRFAHGMSSLSTSGLEVRRGQTFWDQMVDLFLEYVLQTFGVLAAAVCAVAMGRVSSRRRKRR